MKKIVIVFYLWISLVSMSFAQIIDHTTGENSSGGSFKKKVEFNMFQREHESYGMVFPDVYNLNSKSDSEKFLFGNVNTLVEFYYEPPFGGIYGFRITRDSLGTSRSLEIKYITNYREASKDAHKVAREMQLKKSIDIDIFKDLPRDLFNVIWNYNENLLRYDSESYRKILSEELHKNVKVEQHFFSVSDQFVEKLHKKMVSYIHNFNAKGVLSSIISDGYSVTFRTVVGDMVCSLYIHMPQEKSLKWSDFCRQIIDDAIAGNFDESKYMSELDTFGN